MKIMSPKKLKAQAEKMKKEREALEPLPKKKFERKDLPVVLKKAQDRAESAISLWDKSGRKLPKVGQMVLINDRRGAKENMKGFVLNIHYPDAPLSAPCIMVAVKHVMASEHGQAYNVVFVSPWEILKYGKVHQLP